MTKLFKKIIIGGGILSACALALYLAFSFKQSPPPQNQAAEKSLAKTEERIREVRQRLENLEDMTAEEQEELERTRDILSAIELGNDITVEGVEITKSGGMKRVRNTQYGYEIELPEELILARSISSDVLEFHAADRFCEDPSCKPVLTITAGADNPGKLALNVWLSQKEGAAGDPIFSPREKLTVNNNEAWRVTENIPRVFNGFYYYFAHGTSIISIRVSAVDDTRYEEFIRTIAFTP